MGNPQRFAEGYLKFNCNALTSPALEISKAIEMIDKAPIDRKHSSVWADLGCGEGLFTIALAHLLAPGSLVYGVDKEPGVLRNGIFSDHVEIIGKEADFLKNDFSAGPVDGFLMANSLHFVADKHSFLDKLINQLKKEGSFIIIEYDSDQANKWVPHPVSSRELKSLFFELGYKNYQEIGRTRSIYNRSDIYASYIGR